VDGSLSGLRPPSAAVAQSLELVLHFSAQRNRSLRDELGMVSGLFQWFMVVTKRLVPGL